jgi:hypothetical protein
MHEPRLLDLRLRDALPEVRTERRDVWACLRTSLFFENPFAFELVSLVLWLLFRFS